MNITEEDLIQAHSVAAIMDASAPAVPADKTLDDAIGSVSNTDAFYYPVVSGEPN
ncbi:MAG: hypothetical protein JSW27_23290 [Phycisphaerales bacterium]|nr:MAG: hypothetical protein JSW27_23290 [Phycisphaerales bacterium]